MMLRKALLVFYQEVGIESLMGLPEEIKISRVYAKGPTEFSFECQKGRNMDPVAVGHEKVFLGSLLYLSFRTRTGYFTLKWNKENEQHPG